MYRELFSEWCTGRVAPRRFALLWAATIAGMVALLLLVLAVALATGITAKAAHANPQQWIWLGLIFVGSFFGGLAVLFNITVKRGRDIGIPGFVTGVGFLALFLTGGLGVFLTVFLALIPSETFARSSKTYFSR